MKTPRSLLFILAWACFGMTGFASQGNSGKVDTLVLGGGCFWCLEGAYEIVPGVLSVENGYSAGKVENPTYKQICTGETGHAEVVRITFDPTQVSIERLFELFWKIHDPTTLNRQGADVGTQYRSIILYGTEAQKQAAEAAIVAEQKKLSQPIVTQVQPLVKFWVAEDYHQDYFRKNPDQGYCQYVVRPKVEKVREAVKGH